MRQAIASVVLLGVLGTTVSPVHARGRHHGAFDKAGEAGANAAGEVVAIVVGVTVGVLAVTGASLWYYFHRRRRTATAAVSNPPEQDRPLAAPPEAPPTPEGTHTAPPS
jgi:hypothetical protein